MDAITAEYLGHIKEVTDNNRRWLRICKEIAEARLPKPIFEAVPDEVWNFQPWGHRIVVCRFPTATRAGNIHIPGASQQKNSVGWVLTVGRQIAARTPQYADAAELYPVTEGATEAARIWGGDADAFQLVGEVVCFAPWSGKELVLSPMDMGLRAIDSQGLYIMVTAGDIWGPNLDVKEQDWSQAQPPSRQLVLPGT